MSSCYSLSFAIKEISIRPKLSTPPHFSIQGGGTRVTKSKQQSLEILMSNVAKLRIAQQSIHVHRVHRVQRIQRVQRV